MAIVGDVLMTFETGIGQIKAPQVDAPPPVEKVQGPKEYEPGPVPASPSTRRLARELGVDLRAVTATGSGGVVTKEDVETHARQKEQVADRVLLAIGRIPNCDDLGLEQTNSADGRILGVSIVGGNKAKGFIGEAALAIEMGALAEDLALVLHPFPTLAETEDETAEIFPGQLRQVTARGNTVPGNTAIEL